MGRKQTKIVGGSLVNVYKRLINDCAFKNSEICHEGGHGVPHRIKALITFSSFGEKSGAKLRKNSSIDAPRI